MKELLYLVFLQWPSELVAALALMAFSVAAMAAPIYACVFIYELAMERLPRWLSLVAAVLVGLYIVALIMVTKDTIAVFLLRFGSGDDY